MNFPTMQQAASFGRHVVTYGMGFVSALAVTHIASPDQAQSATNAISQISEGVGLIVSGGSTLIAFASAIWATVSAGLKSQIASVQAGRTTQVLTSDPKLVAAAPGVKLVPPSEINN